MLITDIALIIANLTMFQKIANVLSIISFLMVASMSGGAYLGYKYVTSEDVRKFIKSTITNIGEKRIGIKSSEVGTHSIRSTFVMLLILNKVPLPTIMKLGRWKSHSVLEYIKANVEDFSKDISDCIANDSTGEFYTHPNLISSINY